MSSENLKSESLLRLISLSNGELILGRIALINHNVIRLVFPVSLAVIYYGDEDAAETSFIPYLAPFARFDPFAVVNFNIKQVVSFAEPSQDLSEKYEKFLQKVIGYFLEAAAGAEKMTGEAEDKIDPNVFKHYSSMIH